MTHTDYCPGCGAQTYTVDLEMNKGVCRECRQDELEALAEDQDDQRKMYLECDDLS